MGEIMLVGLTSPSGEQSPMELRTAADWRLRKRLLTIPGIAQVVPIGGELKQYQVRVKPAQLRAYDISLEQVLEATENANENASGGIYRESGRGVLVRGLGRTRDVADLASTTIVSRDGAPVRLGNVAEVDTGAAPRFGTAGVNGEPGVILSILKQPGVNTLDLTERVKEELDQIQKQLPPGMEINASVFEQADFITVAIGNVVEALRDGALLVVVILFLFLWNLRTTGISVLAIPLSLSVALLAMWALGATINTMTLGGMAIAIGALVDDAIIDVENVFRRLKENRQLPEEERQSLFTVVFEASKEVRGPIVSATVIISLVFAPLFFLSGVQGRLLAPLGLAYIAAILASLVVAVTVTPVLCYYLLPGISVMEDEKEPWLVRKLKTGYAWVLRRVMGRPYPVIGAAAALLLVAVALVPFMGRGFLPEFQEGTLVISAVTVPGTDIEASTDIGQRIERMVLDHPAVESVSRRTGRAELSEHTQGTHAAEIDVGLDLSQAELDEVEEDLRAELAALPGMNITIGQPLGHRIDHMLSGTRASIAIKLFGPDLYRLRSLAEQIRTAAEGVDGVVDLAVEQQADVPQLQIQARRDKMAKYGVTPGYLAEHIDVAFNGETVSQIRDGQRTFDLVVRFASENRSNADQIRNALIDTPLGPRVPLSQLADVEVRRGPNTVSREDVQRKIVVSSNVEGRDVGSVVEAIRQNVNEQVNLPSEYRVEYGGQFQSAQTATRNITLMSLVVLVAVFFLLYQQFGSVKVVSLILVNLPLALTGGIFTLWVTGGELNIAALVGFITLFGVAIRNGILLVSHYGTLLKEEGASFEEAIFRGSMERLNPILMTALTAGLALIPLALGGGEPGKEIQTPMAIVVLGGLLTATFLNMVVVPVLFERYAPREGLEEAGVAFESGAASANDGKKKRAADFISS
jgi:CzcA family heavy metal efflux pump